MIDFIEFSKCFVLLWFFCLFGWFGLRGRLWPIVMWVCQYVCSHVCVCSTRHRALPVIHCLSTLGQCLLTEWGACILAALAGQGALRINLSLPPRLGLGAHTALSRLFYRSWESKLGSWCLESKFYYQLSHVSCPKARSFCWFYFIVEETLKGEGGSGIHSVSAYSHESPHKHTTHITLNPKRKFLQWEGSAGKGMCPKEREVGETLNPFSTSAGLHGQWCSQHPSRKPPMTRTPSNWQRQPRKLRTPQKPHEKCILHAQWKICFRRTSSASAWLSHPPRSPASSRAVEEFPHFYFLQIRSGFKSNTRMGTYVGSLLLKSSCFFICVYVGGRCHA